MSISYMSKHFTPLPSYCYGQSYWDYALTFVSIHKFITMHVTALLWFRPQISYSRNWNLDMTVMCSG